MEYTTSDGQSKSTRVGSPQSRSIIDEAKDRAAGRETVVFAKLGIQLPDRGQHIRCPFPDHDDHNPSWRWDAKDRKSHCSCGHEDIIGNVQKVLRVSAHDAGQFILECLPETDDVIFKKKVTLRAIDSTKSTADQNRKLDDLLTPHSSVKDNEVPRRYLSSRTGVDGNDLVMPSTPYAGYSKYAYYHGTDKNNNPVLIGHHPASVFGMLDRDGKRHVHRIWCGESGVGKAKLFDSNGKPLDPKKLFTKLPDENIAGRAVLFGQYETALTCILGEGIENSTVLAYAFKPEIEAGTIYVAAGVTAAGVKAFRPFPQTTAVILAPDRDEAKRGADYRKGEQAARAMAATHGRQMLCSIALPGNPGQSIDWKDMLAEKGVDAVRTAILNAELIDIADKQDAKQPDATINGPFVRRENGVYFRGAKDGTTELEKICSPLDVIAVTHDEHGNGWGRVLAFTDLAGRQHEWAMPMSMAAGDGTEIKAELLDQGLQIMPGKQAGQRLIHYLMSCTPLQTWLSVSRPGWHGDCFILPDETFGTMERKAVLQRERSLKHNMRSAGMLDDWKDNIARFCVDNPYLGFAVSAAFAAPLLSISNEQGGGFHIRGDSSGGKSTTLEVGGSVWGGGGQNGYLTSWRATDNGLESIGEGHCDALLCMDEIGQADARTLGSTAYMLANGQGKVRAGRTGSARPPAEWRLLFLSNGEESLAARMNEAGSKTHVGMEVRLADIPVRGKWGVIDELHDFENSKDLINHLKKATRSYYGTPVREYLRRLVAMDKVGVAQVITELQSEFRKDHVPPDAAGQVLRVANRFALVAAGGELATEMSLTGWHEGEATQAVARCFKHWLDARGTSGNSEDDAAIQQVKHFLEVHGASRFSNMEDQTAYNDSRIINRAGYIRHTKEGDTEYLLFRGVFRQEVCKGFDYQKVQELLANRNLLARDNQGKLQVPVKKTAGFENEEGKSCILDRFYCISSKILDEV
jgi:uncharacterized protein (DUF927 family)